MGNRQAEKDARIVKPILLQTVNFKNKGGWTVDQQFVDQMGSAFLLAHGMGVPVADAVGMLRAERVERVRVWVRTRDWVSPQGPGRFVVKIGAWTSKELGVETGEWHWEDCGVVELPKGEVDVRLHDLTGFDGRCDAILLVNAEEEFVPDDAAPWEWRRKVLGLAEPAIREFDFVVVGGGYAGLCAAVAAARRGVKTALVHDRAVFGGNGSNEVRVGPIGGMGLKPFPRNSDLAYELSFVTRGKGMTSGGLRPLFDDRRLDAWLAAEKNLTVYRETRCVSCQVDCGDGAPGIARPTIVSVVVRNVITGLETILKAKQFADCSGDSTLAIAAGAEVRTKPEEGESLKGAYGSTNFWTTRWTSEQKNFPSCPWALPIDETNCAIARPKSEVVGDYPFAAGWNWESGFGKDAVTDGEWIRDYNFRAAYGMWDYLKNRSPEREKYAKAEMDWLAVVLGKRAARRVIGDYVLTEKDLTEHQEYSDGVVTTTWFLDLHMPHPMNEKAFPEGAFRSIAYDDPRYAEVGDKSKGGYKNIRPYAIPYRCFYSRDVANLFVAGKNISATHVAMASVRVENTVAQMGAMVGRAASLCVKNGWTPRELGEEHFEELVSLLARPGRLSRLAKQGQGRVGVKGTVKYWMRVAYHKLKKMLGKPYLEELAG